MWDLNILDAETDLPNKAGEIYQRLYHEEWRSSQILQGNEKHFRGFMGTYKMKILKDSLVLGEFSFQLENDLEIKCKVDLSNALCV